MRIALRPVVFGVLLLAVFAALPHPAAAQEASTLLQRVEAKYDPGQGLRATFRQTMRSDFSGQETKVEGTLVVRGDSYRVETPERTLVTNGETTWVYNPMDNQVIINDYAQSEASFSPETLFANYTERFAVTDQREERLNGTRHAVLELQPRRDDDLIQSATLWINPGTTTISQLRVVDRNGTTSTFELEDVDLRPSIADGTFTYTPPADADVVDLRS
jgi:outer membrane lipoprotein carrier protein